MKKIFGKASDFLDGFSKGIVKGKWICLIVFIILTIGCACCVPFIKIEYDLTSAMPKESYTSEALEVLKKEFDDKGMTYVYVKDIAKEDATALVDEIKTINGVANVTFVADINYKNGSALYTVNLKDYDSTKGAFDAVESIINYLEDNGQEAYLTGQSAYSYFVKEEVEVSILKVGVVIVILILVILFFTSKTYFEVLLMLIVFAVAVVINMGTNILFNGISYLANLVALVLQLALSLDYMVILLHRYMEERATKTADEAASSALSHGIVEILSSSLTTIAGLGSLLLMSLPIGVEIGLALGKSIIASLLSVIGFMPALLVLFDKPLMRSKHKPFVPNVVKPARAIIKGRKVIAPVFIVIVALSCVGQFYNTYSFNYNGGSMIAEPKAIIEPDFGSLNSLVVVVPKGNPEKERELINYVNSFEQIDESATNALSSIALAENVYLTTELGRDDLGSVISSLMGGTSNDLINSFATGLFDGYLTAKGITDTNAKVRLIDLLEYVVEEHGETLAPMLGEYGSMLDSLTFAKANLESANYSRITFTIESGVESEETFALLDELDKNLGNYYSEFYMAGESIACYDMASYFTRDNLIVSLCSAGFVFIILLFTFRNLLLPIVLLLAIQGGIWINFVVPFLSSSPVAFIGYLIITAVQMGATIDYAIVLTNRYRTIKDNYVDRYEAMAEAQNAVFPTIITSGIILIGTGFALSFLASGMVSAMGGLLGVGALASVLIVLFVLPSLLLVTEKAVDKTDFNKLFKRKVK